MVAELEHVRKAFRELGKSLKSLPADPSPKAVHKLRTATRRVEAIAAALPPHDGRKSQRLLKSIEPVRKAAGGVRDMDVLTANVRKLARYASGNSLTRLTDLLQNARQQNAAELSRVLSRRRKAARQNLKEYSRLLRSALAPANAAASASGRPSQSHEGIQAVAMNVFRELGEWPPLDASNIHAFRLKVKELRYTLQLDAGSDPAFVAALGDVQRRVGDWHDWDQLAEIAREILQSVEDQSLLTRIDLTAKRRFAQALAAANALRGRYLSAPRALGI